MVYITGDIHGDTTPVYNLFQKYQPTENDIIVMLGDVALNYTGQIRDRLMKQEIARLKSTFFCIHGNHEIRPAVIPSYEKQWHGGRVLYEEDFPNILFPADGDIFDIEGRQCIVIGGAYSVDKFFRLRMGYKWWPDEQPTPSIREYVEQQVRTHSSVDAVFSHTCPFRYIPTECFLPGIDQSTVDNSTEHWLDTIEKAIDYKAWYLGHWHINKRIDKMHFLMHDVEIF